VSLWFISDERSHHITGGNTGGSSTISATDGVRAALVSSRTDWIIPTTGGSGGGWKMASRDTGAGGVRERPELPSLSTINKGAVSTEGFGEVIEKVADGTEGVVSSQKEGVVVRRGLVVVANRFNGRSGAGENIVGGATTG
jgi:hypothetical protein